MFYLKFLGLVPHVTKNLHKLKGVKENYQQRTKQTKQKIIVSTLLLQNSM